MATALLLAVPQLVAAQEFPSFEQVKRDFHASDAWLLDRNGQRIQRVRTDFTARRGAWTPLADTSPALLHAILLTEDRRFYAHSGVDWSAVGAAAWSNLWNTRTRGASTITMQLAGLLNDALRARPGGRSWGQKWRQLWSARTLEQEWRKDEVLEAYLNLVPFRGELIGIDAMARSLFGKAPRGLDQRESALAAALLRAPNATAERVAERACLILQQASSPWGADCKALQLYTEAALRNRHYAAMEGPAPHFARQILAQLREQAPQAQLPRTIASTLDLGLQRHAVRVLREHLAALQGQNVQDGAVLVLDNASGNVLAWVGSSGATLSQASEVDAVVALRQPGSTLKPFLYAQAIAERRLTAASLLDDSPARIPTEYGIYAPENYDLGYKGWVSVRQALGSSLNIPAVRALRMVSPEAFSQQLRALGFELPEPSGFYGYSLALGGVDVTLLQLTNAYRTLANGGALHPVRLLQADGSDRPAATAQALDAQAAFIVTDILADRHARMLTFGTDSALATRFWSAVKTGTSKDMRDNWTVGFTAHHTIGVWVGNADGSPMQDVSGISGAAPVWASVAAYVNRLRPSQAPTPPQELERRVVTYAPLQPDGTTSALVESARYEWFLPGTAQDAFALAPSAMDAPADGAMTARILEPSDSTIIALDPDIPPANQLVRVRTSDAGITWHVNGQPVHGLHNPRQWYWAPTPGRHRFELRSPRDDAVLDSIQIEVRGAQWQEGRTATR
ncbi:penicillin-binding protein [Lampropedia cohaerens]|uniref:peptidoglycan glycosyltransferase n=1 Tax=Lampropedia cohaerens TaxID=1610491 RepID=A0A0U1PWK7_9BURK|nr:penicillin-binding protein [Lampropedia cohaerens]